MTDSPRITVKQSWRCEPDVTVAFRGQMVLDGQALRLAASAINARIPAGNEGAWGIFVSSPFLLLATLSAVQGAGCSAVLLPHIQPDFLERVRSRCVGLIVEGEQEQPGMIGLPPLDVLIEEGMELGALSSEWSHPVGLLTSGSSGEPICVYKSPVQLIAEIAALETAFGSCMDPTRVICGTTSHQHLYGFTFRVMWPFLTGRALADGQIVNPGEISAAIEAHGRIVLVSSPAFLKRSLEMLNFDELNAAEFVAFSSGGPLDEETAWRFNKEINVSLIEIYGSTETGVVASRISQGVPQPLWRPLPGVRVEVSNGLLAVQARHLPDDQPFLTEDRAEETGDGFLLKGRRDQIVKVADKRVSLSELDRLLNAHPNIEEARVLLIEKKTKETKEKKEQDENHVTDGILAAVIEPDPDGWTEIARHGKTEFCRKLRNLLSESVDRVTTPKRWRLVGQLPRNTQGKIEVAALRSLFSARQPTPPDWEVVQSSEHHWAGLTTIDAELPELDGHFPGNPIVPGVAQLSWAAGCARNAFGLPALSGSLEAVKFRHPLTPVRRIRLSLILNETADKVQFEIADDQKIYSSGRLLVDGN